MGYEIPAEHHSIIPMEGEQRVSDYKKFCNVMEGVETQKRSQQEAEKEMSMQKELKGQAAVLQHISQAQQHLQKAVAAGAASTPLVAEIPVFQQLTQMSKDLTPAMQAVAKMRGLG